ncbi:MAG: MgtC/SapB family protein [Gammaproteobacteria bacterium]|nr:MgtC/SapB family protein [Gammaproteobacteria bacterium]MDE2250416.1 MgtC/SapB family protein [Gammaproteobacteria bacterium]
MHLQMSELVAIAVACGIGLLVGIERERRKGSGPQRGAAGVRTFLIVALVGVLSALAGGPVMPLMMALAVGALAVSAYRRDHSEDPGMTTEVALLATFLLGVLSNNAPVLAAGIGALLAIALAARDWLHHFVRRQLSAQEIHDGLLLAACALVVLPLMPDRPIDPYGAFNPRTAWKFTVLVMSINALGYLAQRVVGARLGLPLAGLAAGFISSSAAHAAMGTRARAQPALRASALAGAAWSSVATFAQLVLVLAVVSPALLQPLLPALLAALLACALAASWLAAHSRDGTTLRAEAPARVFRLREALLIGGLIAAVLLMTTLAGRWLGARYAVATLTLGAFADVHSATASAGMLCNGGALTPRQAALAIGLAVTANTATKLTLAWRAGGRGFALRLAPGLLLAILAGVAGWLLFNRAA